jgi:hypothetical protein
MLGRKNELYEVVEAASIGAAGRIWNLRVGDCLPAKHPVLAANPSLFRAVGSGHPTQLQSEPAEEPKPEKPVHMFRAKKTVSVEGCWLPSGFQVPGRTIIEAGETVPESHPILKNNKKDFERVTP